MLSDGSYITANAEVNSDIFWAIRGGGGNFGIVTSFLFRLVPVQEVYCGPMFWELKDMKKSFSWFDELMKKTRNDLYGFYLIQTVPPAEPFPKELQLKKYVV